MSDKELAPLPYWIKTGTNAMLGTKYTTMGFSSLRLLRIAVGQLPPDMGKWLYMTEGQWSDKAKKMVKRYVGVIKENVEK